MVDFDDAELEPEEVIRLSKKTKQKEPMPDEVLKALAPLSETERKMFKITSGEVKRGKQGSPEIAALLTVNPNDYSDEQLEKAQRLKLHKLSRKAQLELVQEERAKQDRGYST